MMADFDPDAYLAQQSGGGGGGFNPDEYLKETAHYSPIESGLEGYLKGASANWRDEVYGASKASGLPDWLGGFRAPVGAARLAYEHYTQPGKNLSSLVTGDSRGPVQKEYERARDEKRREEAAMQAQNPWAFGAGEVTGGVTGALLMPEARAAATPSLVGNLGRAALAGGEYGALAGAGEGEGLADTATRAGVGAITGAGLGAAGNLAAEAAAPIVGAVARRWNAYRNPEDAATRRIAQSAEADANAGRMGMTPQDLALARATGMRVGPVDVGGENMLSLARSAANTSPEARGALTDLARDRFLTQNPRIANFIRQQTGGGNATEDLEHLTTMASAANRPAYRAAYAAGENGIWNDNLARMAGNSPAIRRAMENAVERGRDRATAEGFGAFNPGVTFENGVMQFGRGRGAPPYPNMQFWDYTQRELRDMATAAARTGHNEQAGALRSLHRQLLGELDNANPAFARARQGAAHFFGAQNALEAGQNFARSSANIPGARQALARMSGPERELFARGYASDLVDQIERAGDNRNAVLHNAFNSVAGRERTRLALNPGRGQQLEAMVRLETLGDRLRGALGNSNTARQLHELGMAGGDSVLEGGINPFHMSVPGLARALFHRANQYIDERVSGAVGRMLASDDPVVHGRITQAIARNGAAMQNLRQLTRTISQGTGRVAAGAGTEAIAGNKPNKGFKHGGHIYRADGGDVNDDDLAASASGLPQRPSPTQQWQSAIEEQRQRDLRKPSMGEQVADIVTGTGAMMLSPLTNLAGRMQQAYEGGIDWSDPDTVGKMGGETVRDMLALGAPGAAMAERGTVGALGGKPGAAPKIIAAATRYKGVVGTGPIHSDSLYNLGEKLGLPVHDDKAMIDFFDKEMRNVEHGFVTSDGRFLTRGQAIDLAGSPDSLQAVGKEIGTGGTAGAAERGTVGAQIKSMEDLRPVYNEIVKSQHGLGTVDIADVYEKSGLPLKEFHDLLMKAVKAGNVNIHPTTTVGLPSRVTEAGINIPGFNEPFVTMAFKKRESKGRASGGRIPGELKEANKSTHQEVGYLSVSPRKKQKCELCTKFIPDGPACKKVRSPIEAGGWCRRFVLKVPPGS